LAGIGLGTKLAAGACLESAWPHLQLVYRLLQLLIQRIEPNREGGLARQIDGHFVDQLLALFNSEDPREREEAKEALHSLYSRMVPMRAEIRKRIGWLLASNVFEQFPCRGMPEILEVLGDIING
jgi:serine/threonine-protein phosphatase 2A regulatory subunit B'